MKKYSMLFVFLTLMLPSTAFAEVSVLNCYSQELLDFKEIDSTWEDEKEGIERFYLIIDADPIPGESNFSVNYVEIINLNTINRTYESEILFQGPASKDNEFQINAPGINDQVCVTMELPNSSLAGPGVIETKQVGVLYGKLVNNYIGSIRGYLHTLGYYIEGGDYDLIRVGTVLISCRQIKIFDDPSKDGEQISDDVIEYLEIRRYDEFLP